ncbi:alkaline shock response membrane anchor protein AmaP [Lacticaseibacillus hulanensis]|uniref:alkaline shock response membrane anchor protein AmaP n=1 Tax=Lacticaseibacillus hulanensis TaxID=2493111 RepID=UPI000FDB89DF|nr:alkaline shock response membrane anchor protein AmaP [Lacticaseibacillus hulanensis]
MRSVVKFGLGLVAVIGLLQALLVAAYVWPVVPIDTWLDNYWVITRWILLGMTAVVFATFLVLLLIAVLRRTTTDQLVIKHDRGSIKLSRRAIESSVAKAVAAEYPVRSVDVDVKMHKKQVARAEVTTALTTSAAALDVGKAIEATVKTHLRELLGVDVAQVMVKIIPQKQMDKSVARVV